MPPFPRFPPSASPRLPHSSATSSPSPRSSRAGVRAVQRVPAVPAPPRAGRVRHGVQPGYFKIINGTRVMQVCNAFSQTVYQTCKGLTLPGVATLDRFFPTPERFMEDLFGKVGTAFGVYNFTVAVTPDASDQTQCYNGPKKLPPMPFCCDPLPIPIEKCPAKVMNFTEYPNMRQYINRTVTDRQCDKFRCSTNGGDGGGTSSKLNGITSPTDCIPTSNTGGSSNTSSSSSGSSSAGSSGGKVSHRLHATAYFVAAAVMLAALALL
ncbi:unnamed protein product [Closterium sp. Naga37s-1]|nr:unnamed protein product [Closterium sp. Naga37s-1]